MITSFRTWLKGLAALVAVVYLGGNVGAFLHTTMERHVVCSDHGDLIHADSVQITPEIGQNQLQKSAAHEAGHEHCATAHMMTFGREISESPTIVSNPYVIEPIVTPRLAATPIRGPTLAVYRLAPKTSPPHRLT